MPHGEITGVDGFIKWSYYTAAQLHRYTVRRVDDRWTLQAVVVLSDAYKIAQRPLRFVAPTQYGEWVWPIYTLEIADGSLTATLGPPES